jgi:hypothetical protein
MDAIVQALLHLVVDLRAKAGETAKSGLDVTARAAETIVQIKVTKGGIEVIPPHQANHAPTEPNTFRVTSRTINGLGGLGEFIGLALVVLGGVGCACGRLARLVWGRRRPALGEGSTNADHQGQSGKNQIAQHRKPTLKHPLTHKFPELVLADVPLATIAVEIGPECGGNARWNPMTEILDFVQQTHNFIALW